MSRYRSQALRPRGSNNDPRSSALLKLIRAGETGGATSTGGASLFGAFRSEERELSDPDLVSCSRLRFRRRFVWCFGYAPLNWFRYFAIRCRYQRSVGQDSILCPRWKTVACLPFPLFPASTREPDGFRIDRFVVDVARRLFRGRRCSAQIHRFRLRE